MKLCGYVCHQGTYTPLWGAASAVRQLSLSRNKNVVLPVYLCLARRLRRCYLGLRSLHVEFGLSGRSRLRVCLGL